MTYTFVAAMLLWTGAPPEDFPWSTPKPYAGTVPPATVKPGPYPNPYPAGKGKSDGSEPEPGALTVGDVIAALQLDESTFRFIDEPPGKLREIQATATLRDTKVKVAVSIQIRYTPELMSVTGTWAKAKVRAARVIKVTIGGIDGTSMTVPPKPDPSVPRFAIPLRDPQKIYGASWLSIRSNRLGVRYHTGLTTDRIAIYALSAQGAEEIATWSVGCDELIRQSVGESCVFSDCGRIIYYITETEVRARWFGPVPVDVCLCQLKVKDAYWEQLSLTRSELLCVSRIRNTKQLQVTTIQLTGTDAGSVDTREVKNAVLEKIDRLHILDVSPEWLYLVNGDRRNPDTRLEVLDLQTDRTQVLAEMRSHPASGATSNSGLLAIGTFSGRVHLIDLKSQQSVRGLEPGGLNTVATVSWSRDGNSLAAGLVGAVKGDQLVVYRTPFREKLFSARSGEASCERVALSDKGEWVAGFCSDRIIRVWAVPK